MKKLSVVSLIMALALVFTGCANGELQLYNAFLKTQDISSMESVTNLSFELDGEGLSEENQLMLGEAAKMLNSSKITMNQKMQQNKDKTVVKAQIDMGLDLGGVKTDMNVWVDLDMSKDSVEIVEIIKMPQMLMSMLGEEYANKEYIEYDFNEVLGMQEEQMDFKELMNFSKDIQPKLTDFMKNYSTQFDSKLEMVEYKGNRLVNDQVAHLYEVKLDDESFKSLIRYSVNNFMENEDIMKFMTEYMDMVFNLTKISEVEKSEAKLELEKMEKDLPELKDKFNKFMDEFDKVKVLDDEGIVIEYAINKDGYIVSEKGSINLSIDLAKLSELNEVETNPEKMAGVIKLQMKFDTINSNINEDIKIEIPKLTDENSLKISEIIKLGL